MLDRVLVTVLALGVPVVAAGPAVAGPAPSPSLSISIDDGHVKVAGGDELTYRIKVANTGAADLAGLRLTQSLPPGLRFTAADHDGRRDGQVVTWTVSVPAGKDVTVTGQGVVGSVTRGTSRLASSACAFAAGEDRPAVCSTDSDELDATALAAAPVEGGAWWYWTGGGLLVAGAVAGLLYLRRRRAPARAETRVPVG